MRLLLPAFLVFLLALLVLGVLVPRRSRRAQSWIECRLGRLERRSGQSAGRLRHLTATGLRLIRKVSGASAEAGRATRDKIAPG